MQKSSKATIIVGLLLCVAAVVLLTRFSDRDEAQDGDPQASQLSGDEQAIIDALQQSVAVDYKTGAGGRIVQVSARGPEINDDAATQLSKLTELQDVQLAECVLGADGLRAIASLPQLGTLRLEKAQLADGAPQELASAGQLKQLFLADSQIDDAALETIGTLTGLELLDLNRTAVTDAGLPSLSGLNSLQKLYLAETVVTGEGFASFPESHGLILLNLSSCPVTPAGIDELQRFPALTSLYLDGVQFDDALVARLMDVTTKSAVELQGLFLSQTPLTDSAIEPLKALAEFPNLSLVGLNNTQISKAAFRELAEVTPETRYLVDYEPGGD